MPLVGEGFALSQNPPQRIQSAAENDETVSPALLVRARNAKPAPWVLIAGAGPDVRVNGDAMLLGVRVLTDRDEISVAGVGELFFSTESLARVEEFTGDLTGATPAIYCPRCRQTIDEGVSAVKCPQCGVWYHETEDLNCWTYAETCALCPQPTDLDAGFRWTPEGL
jgi:hypothetical protein